jgi:hypothetical protein
MSTQKPLLEMMPDLVQHIHAHKEFLQFNQRVFNILEGQLKREVEDSLRKEILSFAALNRCLQRIPSINVLKKVTDKLSKVYVESPIRMSDKKQDTELMENISKISKLDSVMMEANRLLNATHSCAIEPYVKDGEQKFRVLPNHLFLPYSDDPVDPMNMTVFIKLIGTTKLVDYTTTSKDGTNIEEEKNNIRVVNVYQAFSDDEVIIFNEDGGLMQNKMIDYDIEDGVNRLGTIPQIYLNSSKNMLVPYPNQAGLDMSVLIPKLLTDLNYSVQFLSHSILWTKNANLEDQELNPDVVLDLGEGGGAGDIAGDPEIGTIDPKVEIEGQLQLIQFQFSGYLAALGIKTGNIGSMMPGREASGFAKAMDEGDATAARKEQSEHFRHIEKELWSKMYEIQNRWSNMGLVKESRQFSRDFIDTFSIKFAEMKILKTDREKLEETKMWKDLDLMTPRQAVKFLKPDLTDEQVDKWISELDTYKKEEFNNSIPDADDMDLPDPDPARQQRDEELG